MQLIENRQASAARSLTPAARHLGQSAAKKVISFFGARLRVHPNLQQTAEKEIVASLDANLGTVCSAADVGREWVEKGESAADGRAQVETALDAAEKCSTTIFQGQHRRVKCRHRPCR